MTMATRVKGINRGQARPAPLPFESYRAALGGMLVLGGLALACVDQARAADVDVLETGRPDQLMLVLQGPIVGGELKKVTRLVNKKARGRSVTIMLNSPGGKLAEGLRLGTYFHNRRISTLVAGGGGSCSSACALAFLGGRDRRTGAPMRIKPSGGKLGFHQFRNDSYDPLKIYTKADYNRQVAEAQNVTRAIVIYLKNIGEDLGKLKLMLRKPTESMYFVSDKESLSMGIHVLDEERDRLIAADRLTRGGPNS